ncbi:hypothetical protein QBC46DRAFT_389607, partial [Diplogelasinospora grovesii]
MSHGFAQAEWLLSFPFLSLEVFLCSGSADMGVMYTYGCGCFFFLRGTGCLFGLGNYKTRAHRWLCHGVFFRFWWLSCRDPFSCLVL